MPVISVRIPQLGEGLQEALLVEFLKKPGDPVRRDEPIYVMETDKATTDVESPFAGTLVEWTVQAGSVLAIGSEVARMEVAEGVQEMPSGHSSMGSADSRISSASSHSPQPSERSTASAADSSAGFSRGDFPAAEKPEAIQTATEARSGVFIPPRTRKYLKEVGLLDEVNKIPVRGSKMMPEDVDAYLETLSASPSDMVAGARVASEDFLDARTISEPHTVVPLPKSQITLNYRMKRGAGVCIPVTIVADIDWSAVQALRSQVTSRSTNSLSGQPTSPSSAAVDQETRQLASATGFAIACWGVVQAMKQHSKFRSALTTDGTALRVYSHVNLGVAVALPGDEMLTAVIRRADQMSDQEFFRAYEASVQAARQGQDQADETTTLTVSNIGKAGMRMGFPAVVAPAVATLALGEVFPMPIPDGDTFRFCPTVTATLSFDHRIVNGVGAANFLNDVRSSIHAYSTQSIHKFLKEIE